MQSRRYIEVKLIIKEGNDRVNHRYVVSIDTNGGLGYKGVDAQAGTISLASYSHFQRAVDGLFGGKLHLAFRPNTDTHALANPNPASPNPYPEPDTNPSSYSNARSSSQDYIG